MPRATLQINQTKHKQFKLNQLNFFAIPLMAVAGLATLGIFAINQDVDYNASASNTIVTTDYSNEGEYVGVPVVSNDIDLSLTGTSAGAYTGGSHTVSVDTNVDTYALYISTTNTNSAMRNTTNSSYSISATTGTADSAATMSNNSWGYAINSFNPGSNAETAYTYDTLTSGNGSTDQWNSSLWAKVPYVANADTDVSDADQIFAHDSSMAQSNNSTDVYYGIKANTSLTAGEYSATVVYTVVADITESAVGLDTITNLQDATPELCAESELYSVNNKTYYLTDTRTNLSYPVRKLADGNCWIVKNIYFPDATATVDNSATAATYHIIDLNTTYDGYVSSYNYKYIGDPSHGSYTQSFTSGYNMNSTNGALAMCPRNWTLPSGDGNQFQTLLSAYSGSATFLAAWNTQYSGIVSSSSPTLTSSAITPHDEDSPNVDQTIRQRKANIAAKLTVVYDGEYIYNLYHDTIAAFYPSNSYRTGLYIRSNGTISTDSYPSGIQTTRCVLTSE